MDAPRRFLRPTELIAYMGPDDVCEVLPFSGIFHYSEIPRGYDGAAYFRDDPRLPIVLAELEEDGWEIGVDGLRGRSLRDDFCCLLAD